MAFAVFIILSFFISLETETVSWTGLETVSFFSAATLSEQPEMIQQEIQISAKEERKFIGKIQVKQK